MTTDKQPVGSDFLREKIEKIYKIVMSLNLWPVLLYVSFKEKK